MSKVNEIWRIGHDNTFFTQQNNFVKAKVGFKPSFKFCDTSTCVGIEVEVENIGTSSGVVVDDGKNYSLWKNVEDGSLRNNGREFVSIPVSGENIEFALHSLDTHLHKNKNCVNHQFTDRTSVHVHVDCSTLTLDNIATLLLVYHMTEAWFYNYAGGDRDVNIFTVPLLDTIMFDDNLRYFWNNPNGGAEIDRLVRGWTKYTGLNLCPLRQYGTVEFRHMHGNISTEFLCHWIDSILQLRKYAVSNKFDDVLSKIQNINTTSEYGQFINEIFRFNRTLVENSTLILDKELEKASARIKNILAKSKSDKKVKFITWEGSVFDKLGIVSNIKSPVYKKFATADTRMFALDTDAAGNIQAWLNGEPIRQVQPVNDFDEVPEVTDAGLDENNLGDATIDI